MNKVVMKYFVMLAVFLNAILVPFNRLLASLISEMLKVNALLKERLLKAEVSANKSYYSLNRESLSAYLDNVKNYFL